MLEQEFNNQSPSGDSSNTPSFHDELELKLLVAKSPGQKFVSKNDFLVFSSIEKRLKDLGWTKTPKITTHLLTRQFDTKNAKIIKKTGDSIRMRARCHDNNLNHTSLSDVCIKIGKEITNSGAVKRSEYEAHTKNFNDLDLKPLKKKYLSTKGEHKKLQKFLNSIEKKSLIEFFRIDVKRSRVIVELDENVTKIKGKRFCAEVILDDVAHIIDIPPSKKSSTHMPYIYNHDLEIEAEVLYEPCEYDTTPENAKYVTSPDMTPHEIEHCLNILKKELIKASSNKAYENTLSKCERGFIELGIIHGPQVQNAPPSHKKTRPPLIDLFKASAEGRLTPVKPNLLPKNLKPNILGYRSVAYKK